MLRVRARGRERVCQPTASYLYFWAYTPRTVSKTDEQAEDDRKARERDERRRQDRLKREDFKEFLQGMVEENAITADTTWKDLKRSIEEEDAYKAMEGQPGGARDVFDDIVADLRRQVE